MNASNESNYCITFIHGPDCSGLPYPLPARLASTSGIALYLLALQLMQSSKALIAKQSLLALQRTSSPELASHGWEGLAFIELFCGSLDFSGNGGFY